MPHKFIRAYTQTPKELFRLNNGRAVRLRSSPAFFKPLGAVDLFTVEGKARPLALNPASYECMTFESSTGTSYKLIARA